MNIGLCGYKGTKELHRGILRKEDFPVPEGIGHE
jgi:hypothetical protein